MRIWDRGRGLNALVGKGVVSPAPMTFELPKGSWGESAVAA